MKAITVQQPWAFAIATGAKTVENRTRPHPWRSAVGQRIAIHAGKAWDSSASFDERLITAAKAAGHLFTDDELDPAAYDYGVILATARLAGIHHADAARSSGCRCAWNQWAEPASWHLVLLDIQPVRQPLACRGYQGLWTVPAPIAAHLEQAA